MYVQCSKEAIQSHTRKTLGTVTSLAHRHVLERVKVPNLEPQEEKQSSVYFQHGTFFWKPVWYRTNSVSITIYKLSN